MKKLKKIGAALALTTIILAQGVVAYGANNNLPNMKQIIHAGGNIDEHSKTNSLEAIQRCFVMGNRYIELDFSFTTDGHLVSIHDWKENYFGAEYAPYFSGAVTLEEFKAKKIIGLYTPITIDVLTDWALNRPETYIVTDIKEKNVEGLKYIKENYPALVSRIIPQIYTEGEYKQARDMGYTNIIYTLYSQNYSDKINTEKIKEFANNNELLAIVFDKELVNNNYIYSLKQSGVRLFTHTVNDPIEVAKYVDMGITGVYSDTY